MKRDSLISWHSSDYNMNHSIICTGGESGVDQRDGHPGASGSVQRDGEFRNIWRNDAKDFSFLVSHSSQCATEAADQLAHHFVGVLASSYSAFLCK